MNSYDLGIRCEYFLPLADGPGETHRDIFLGVRDGVIAKIAPWASETWHAIHIINAKNQVVMPGLINGHTHLPMTLFRGLADDLPFNDWLHHYIVPLEAKLVDPEFVRVGTELAALESIRSGVTTLCDMYFYEDVIADVLDRAGLRALVAEAFLDYPSPDNKDLSKNGMQIFERMRERFTRHPRITPCLGPHAPYTCGDELLSQLVYLATQHDVPTVMHVAETADEVTTSLKQYGKTPVKRLFDLSLMSKQTIFAHCVHVNDHDLELMAKTGTSAIYNPESNMKLGAGAAPIVRMLKSGVRVGIGTDGASSNNNLNLFGEMDTGAKLQKMICHNNAAITAHQMLKMATLEGAAALGLEKQVGSLEVGKAADFICVDLTESHMRPIHNLESTLVYSANGSEVKTVVCHGKILMENNEIKVLDPDAIFSRVENFKVRIQENLN